MEDFTMRSKFGPVVVLLTVITSTQNCEFKESCGVVGGVTKLFCDEASAADEFLTNWIGPSGVLITTGVSNEPGVDVEIVTGGFNLIIQNTSKSDVGNYSCQYGFGTKMTCELKMENLEALTCDEKEMNRKVVVTVRYRPYDALPAITVTNSLNEAVPGSFDTSGSANGIFIRELVWTSNSELSEGNYSYTVNGSCDLLTDCSGTVYIPGLPTTVNTAETDGPTPAAPTSTPPTAAPTSTPPTAAPTSAAPTSDDTITTPEPSNNSLTIVYGVCGALGGLVIIFAFCAFVIYKNKKKRSRSKKYKEPKPNRRNHLDNNIPPDYDNPAFSGVQQSRVYKSDMGQPNNGQVSAHSGYLYPGHQKPERNVHVRSEIHGNNFSSRSNDGNYRERPLNVEYYKGPGRRC